ncbi:MAG: cyclic nucleotide-binding domain-containing protein [Candidatus Dormibacteraeota bacterium]|uniref:Cyclic nucleotide-binding domain-containing protein n=1 Tax=Candidatus Amunia macphersoniae TaxID=3127014 RepID=A0A934N969_9BACT|nr:cyclic nucleotide-binding domain-containing protein [Candidatus Dormibacteraeota bacterium]
MATVREDVIPSLERSPLFAGMEREQVRTAAERFDDSTYLAGHGVLTEGLSGPDFFVILEGEADVIVDGNIVHHLRAGDFFGEVAALDGKSRTASVRATSRLRCLTLGDGSFRQFLIENPIIAVNLLPEIVRRFRSVAPNAPPLADEGSQTAG